MGVHEVVSPTEHIFSHTRAPVGISNGYLKLAQISLLEIPHARVRIWCVVGAVPVCPEMTWFPLWRYPQVRPIIACRNNSYNNEQLGDWSKLSSSSQQPKDSKSISHGIVDRLSLGYE
jgi:hypothetical protein